MNLSLILSSLSKSKLFNEGKTNSKASREFSIVVFIFLLTNNSLLNGYGESIKSIASGISFNIWIRGCKIFDNSI